MVTYFVTLNLIINKFVPKCDVSRFKLGCMQHSKKVITKKKLITKKKVL